MPLERIAYVSTSAPTTDQLVVIVDILAVSQRNNARDGITGALVSSDGRFFQVVEGEGHALDRLMARVTADSRHSDIRVVQRQAAPGRLFAGWSMTVPKIAPGEVGRLAKVVEQSERSPASAIELLRSLVAAE